MEHGDLLERALEFLGLEPGFDEAELKNRFYFLSKKYHPDTGEFSSDSLFKELIEYRDVLHSYLEQKTFKKMNASSETKGSHKNDYTIYKQAREIYDSSIHEYYKLTDGNPIFLKGEENPALRKLRNSLEISKSGFENLISSYPESIWIADAKDTLAKIEVWFKEP
ncbi:DnaJ domain protein [Leptospira kmetyi serovar Malaysia str. Bejo-Iso9]|nr:DnaJ domain protein [Leptospira kmetyi serovar Malaysia str. Bejo-Iso9]